MDTGVTGILIAHLGAFDSGELNNNNNNIIEPRHVIYNNVAFSTCED